MFPHETAYLFLLVFRTSRLNLAIVLCSPARETLAYWRKPQLLPVQCVQMCSRYLSWDSSGPCDSKGNVGYPCPVCMMWRVTVQKSNDAESKVGHRDNDFFNTVDVKNCSWEIMRWLKFTTWDVTPFKYAAIHKSFGGSYCFHLQGKRVG